MKMLRPNGKRVSELRRQKGLTQLDCKIDAKTLRKIERGQLTREQTIRRLAEDVFRVPLEALVHADEVAAVRELDAARLEWRKATDRDLILTDKHVNSRSAKVLRLNAISESRFVDTIRAAEILKWHVDLVDPSIDKLDYLEKVGDLVDHFRIFVKGVSGLDTLIPHSLADNKESDFLFSSALSTQKKIIELRKLIGASTDHCIRFFWVFYTFWGLDCDFAGGHHPHEQHVTLVVATDTDRDEVSALVHTGTSPFDDEPDFDEAKEISLDDPARDELPKKPTRGE